jgi:hypothetical protein
MDWAVRVAGNEGWRAIGARRVWEVGLGDAVGVAGGPLDQLDPITVGVSDPTGPRSVRVARVGRRIGRDTLNGKIGEGCIQRLNLAGEMIDTRAEVYRAGGWFRLIGRP